MIGVNIPFNVLAVGSDINKPNYVVKNNLKLGNKSLNIEGINYATDPKTATDDQYIKFEDESLKDYLIKYIEKNGNTDKNKKYKDQITFGEAKTVNKLYISKANYNFPENFNSWNGIEFLINLKEVEIHSDEKNIPLEFHKFKNLKNINIFRLSGWKVFDNFDLLDMPEELMSNHEFAVGNTYGPLDNYYPIRLISYRNKEPIFTYVDRIDGNVKRFTFKELYKEMNNSNLFKKMEFNNKIMGNLISLNGIGLNDINMLRGITFPLNLYISGNFIEDITPLEENNKNFNIIASNQVLLYQPTSKEFTIPLKTLDNDNIVYTPLSITDYMNYVGSDVDLDKDYKSQDYPENKEPLIENGILKLRYKTEEPIIVGFEYKLNDKNLQLDEDVMKYAAKNYVKSGIDYGKGLDKTFNYFMEMFKDSKRTLIYSGNIFIDPSKIKWDSDLFTPETKLINKLVGQEVDENEYKDSITNLPENIEKFDIVKNVNTSTIGDKIAVVRITFEDNSTKDIEITVKVRNKAGIINDIINEGNIKSKEEIVTWGEEFDITDNIIGLAVNMGINKITDVTDPKIDSKQPGNYIGKVKLNFDDGSETIIDVPVKVLHDFSLSNKGNNKKPIMNVDYENKKPKFIPNDVTSEKPKLGPRKPVEEKLITKDHYSYIVGYPDNTFRPNNTITRAETASIFARLSKDQTVNKKVTFKDVKSSDWFSKAVNIGMNQGFINGYEDGTFKPDKPMTRAEFAAVISAYANREFLRNDFADVSVWSTEAIDKAYANGWMKGY